MQELTNIKRKLVDELARMGEGRQALNTPMVEDICKISKALSNIVTFEAMEEQGYSGNARGTSYGHSYGSDREHVGPGEQTSRDGSYGGSYGYSYADREQSRRELENMLSALPRSQREEAMRKLNEVAR